MAIYFAQFFLIALAGATTNVNKSEKNKKRFVYFAYFLLIIVAALRSRYIGTDLAIQFAKRYDELASTSWASIPLYSARTTLEIGYCYFTKFLSMINPDVQFYIIVTSVITYGTVGYFIYKNSVDVRMSTYVLILSGTYYNYMNIVRQALATSLILIGYEILKKEDRKMRRYIGFAAIVILASTVHSAAILCLVLILFDRLKFPKIDIFLGIVATMIFFVAYEYIVRIGSSFLGGQRDYYSYLSSATEGVGHVSFQSLYMVLIILMGFVLGIYTMVIKKRRRMENGEILTLSRSDRLILYASLVCAFCRLMVFRMNIVNRYSYYFIAFLFLLYPRAYQEVAPKNKKIIKWIMYGVLFGYFIMMTLYYEQSFHMTVPYQFFWEAHW